MDLYNHLLMKGGSLHARRVGRVGLHSKSFLTHPIPHSQGKASINKGVSFYLGCGGTLRSLF